MSESGERGTGMTWIEIAVSGGGFAFVIGAVTFLVRNKVNKRECELIHMHTAEQMKELKATVKIGFESVIDTQKKLNDSLTNLKVEVARRNGRLP